MNSSMNSFGGICDTCVSHDEYAVIPILLIGTPSAAP